MESVSIRNPSIQLHGRIHESLDLQSSRVSNQPFLKTIVLFRTFALVNPLVTLKWAPFHQNKGRHRRLITPMFRLTSSQNSGDLKRSNRWKYENANDENALVCCELFLLAGWYDEYIYRNEGNNDNQWWSYTCSEMSGYHVTSGWSVGLWNRGIRWTLMVSFSLSGSLFSTSY